MRNCYITVFANITSDRAAFRVYMIHVRVLTLQTRWGTYQTLYIYILVRLGLLLGELAKNVLGVTG